MKNTLFLALVILAILAASAQKAGSPNWSANGNAVTALAQDYAARVDGLLRGVHASLQNISEGLAAGRLTLEQAQKLKLAATRHMISRLDAIAAIYDVRLHSKDNVGTNPESGAVDASATDKAVRAKLHTNNTVSVEELRREAAPAVVTARAEEVPR